MEGILIFLLFVLSVLFIVAMAALGYSMFYLHKAKWLGVLLGMFVFLVNFSISIYGFCYYAMLISNVLIK